MGYVLKFELRVIASVVICGADGGVYFCGLGVLFYFGRVVRSLYNRLSIQNRYGQGESDCLIKTKHCDGQ